MLLDYFHLLAALIGVVCAYEANLLLKAHELWLLDKRLLWSTAIEFIWFIFCLIAIFRWDLSHWQTLASLLFIVSYLLSCIYTGYLIKRIDLSDPTAISGFRIPRWFLEYHFSFGFIYSLINLIFFVI
jgi:hypothetical protein